MQSLIQSYRCLRSRLQSPFSFEKVSLVVTHSHQNFKYQQHPRRNLSYHSQLPKMAIPSTEEISQRLASLGLDAPLKSFPNCYPQLNPVDVYRAHITTVFSELSGIDPAIVYNSLQTTLTLDKGDLVIPVPALRIKGKKADELAKEWAEKFPESPLLEKPTSSGPFLQFFFKPLALAKLLIPTILKQKQAYGTNTLAGLKDPSDPSKGKKKVIVEFSSPNIAKPFHAGHLRSTIIGGFLANLYETAGWNVYRMNYLGDWGKQYGLLALGFEKYGSEESLQKDPIGHLFDVYVKINQDVKTEKEEIDRLEKEGEDVTAKKQASLDEQARDYFKAMTNGDEKALAQWKRFRDYSIEKYKTTYARLNIHFDEYCGESQVEEERMEATGKILEEKGVTEVSEGAIIVNFAKHIPGKPGKSLERPILKKKDGTSLYLTRDVTELIKRDEKHHFDKMYYVVAAAQDLHLKQLFKIIDLMGYKDLASRVQHINFGQVQGMSTRRGNVVFLDSILNDVGETMHAVMRKNEDKYTQVEDPEKTSDILGISAVMVQDMSGKRINNYPYDPERMTAFEGDTGPYLQYAHARLCSITRKAGISEEELETADFSLLTEPIAINLVRVIAQYPDLIQTTMKTLEPCTILTYLFKMTHTLGTTYKSLRIVGSERELMKARLALYDAARVVLNNGMRILGLTPVERM